MNSSNTPDRVHVVKPPENENNDSSYAPSQNQTLEIIRMLAKIGDKLKRSEAERYELLAELREYRKSLRDLEDKADDSEKAYLAVENKMNATGTLDHDVSQRQIRFEKSLRATEDKMLKAIAGQALMDRRLQSTESKQTIIDDRLDETMREQAKITRKVDVALQDKARLTRKVERLEELVMETQNLVGRDAPKALLTGASMEKENEKKHVATLSAPVWSDTIREKVEARETTRKINNGKALPEKEIEFAENEPKKNDMTKFFTLKNFTTAAIVAAALLLGWSISQMIDTGTKEPTQTITDMPQADADSDLQSPMGFGSAVLPKLDIENTNVPTSMTPAMGNVLDYSDQDLLDALNKDPDALATQLNALEPGSTNDSTAPVESTQAPQDVAGQEQVEQTNNMSVTNNDVRPAINNPSLTPAFENFDALAYAQDSDLARTILAEKGSLGLTDRLQADSNLPAAIKPLENQAFAGNAEAQHDLAAIYTAGYKDVRQDFDRASLWLREAADNGVANARYNLGVLNHQGLGRARDLSRAIYWYKEAAKLGHAEAQYNLGIAYIEGIGTPHNTALAAAFFERAANNGITEAAYNLGLIHDNGLLGQSKADEAFLWYKIAADQGNAEAKQAIVDLSKNLKMSDEDVTNLVNRMQQIYETQNGRRAGGTQQSNQSAQGFTIDKGLITQVQEYLMLTGAYAGPADGINGAATQESIRSYQAANNLPVTGDVTEDLVRNMIGGARAQLDSANSSL